MDIKRIGGYIQMLRKQKGLSQRELAETLSVTFQAVSKWEKGENLPDASLWLDLAAVLDTTTDKILSGGIPIRRKKPKVNVASLKSGIDALEQMKLYLGEDSLFFQGAVEGISNRLHFPVGRYLDSDAGRELLLSEAVIQCLMNGYDMDESAVSENFASENVIRKINKVRFDCGLFASRAQDYRMYRPSYPPQAVDLILSLCPEPVIADLGSGTGKLSELLAEHAAALYAVEPNMQMRQYAEENLGGFRNVHSVSATAEQTTLDDASVDIITAAESFHWFDNERTHREMRRILKKDGYVVLLWNSFKGNPYDEEMKKISEKYRSKKGEKPFGVSAKLRKVRAENLFGDGNYQFQEFDNSFMQSREEFRGGMLSTSFAPDKASEDYMQFVLEVERLFDRYAKDGEIKTVVKTICFWGKLDRSNG